VVDMSDKVLPLEEGRYYELLSFFVSSAYLMYQGEQYDELYPTLRLLEGASRLTQSIIDSGGFESESWPREFVANCERGSDHFITDQDAFMEFVVDATRMLAEVMVERAG
jgi:hypothetical protein